jgi:hypothetical protein
MTVRMPKQAAIGLVLLGALLGSSGLARAQQDAAAPLNPSESACLGQSVGSDCTSSATTAGGTCLAGCCCHYVTDPEGTSTCAPCLACSDTASLDPAYAPGACADGGSLVSDDAGTVSVVPIADAGGTVVMPPPAPTPAGSGGCVIARNVRSDENVTLPPSALLALAVIGGLIFSFRRRTRARAIRLQRRAFFRV